MAEYEFGFAHYGEEREIDATDEEKAIADYIMSLCPISRFVRVSSSYVTVKCKDTDICRFKYTERAKWLHFPYYEDGKKKYIESTHDVANFEDAIRESYAFACKTDNID